jgi:hypothetical protein
VSGPDRFLFRFGPLLLIVTGLATTAAALAGAGAPAVRLEAVPLGAALVIAGVLLPRVLP